MPDDGNEKEDLLRDEDEDDPVQPDGTAQETDRGQDGAATTCRGADESTLLRSQRRNQQLLKYSI